MAENRRILTWSLNAGTTAYEDDLIKFAHKIYSIGIHEFGVRETGKIYEYNSGADYFNNGIYNDGVLMKIQNENHCITYPGIKFFLQPICFGWSKVKPLLDNDATNAEGRLPQDQFIYEMGKIFDLYATSRNTGTPLHWEGIELDVEATLSGIVTTVAYDDKYIAFINYVKNQLCIPRGLKLRVNAFAQWGDNNPYYYRFHNYKKFATATDAHGNASIDELQLMTYDFAWSGSAPGASTPTWWFRQVGEWAKQCFDREFNPSAKLTIDKVFFGSAGYGNRWGLWEEGQTGRSITFRNLLGWQNGLYKHYHQEDSTYIYHDQEYLAQNGYEDPNSKNQIMLQHVYDFGSAKYGSIRTLDGERTAQKGVYNAKDYLTTYSKIQQAQFSGVQDVAKTATVSGKASASGGTTVRNVAGVDHTFTQYTCSKLEYIADPQYDAEGDITGYVCVLESTAEGQVVYDVSPGAGTFHVVALVAYPWYSQRKLGGNVNGASFVVGGDNLPDYYPYMFKAAHWVDIGQFDFTGTEDTITVQGELGHYGTPILGFVICNDFDPNFKGGIVDFNVNTQPFKTKDGTDAPIPVNYAVAVEILRQEARPVIMWEDRFLHYVGVNPMLEATMYYLQKATYGTNGSTWDGSSCRDTYVAGYSYGSFVPLKDEVTNEGYAYFDYESDENQTYYDGNSGQLVFNHLFNGNVEVTADYLIEEGVNAGVRFGSQGAGDGFIFRINYFTRKVELLLEEYPSETMLITEDLAESIVLGDRLTIKVVMHDGKGYFYMGKAGGLKQVFSGAPISLGRTAVGACGIYTSGNPKIRIYVLGISTTDRWDTMEKFEIEINGTTYPFGAIDRPGYSYDEYGYLIYSGIDENVTRDDPTGISLDYEFHVFTIPGFQNGSTFTLRLLDAGLWFANFYIGDAEGCSITYAGDAESFNMLMNIAVNDYGAKGIGLWVLGQEDPKLFEMVPDVVPPLL